MSHIITIKCNGCGACVKMCPADAISGEKDKLHLISAALCINCGVCGSMSPDEKIGMEETTVRTQKLCGMYKLH
jgi:electron transport complex protein RnfB